MSLNYQNGNVIAVCPTCEVITTFESLENNGREHGSIVMNSRSLDGKYAPEGTHRIVFRLLRCAGCGRAGLAAIADPGGNITQGILIEFLPLSVAALPLPKGVPDGILSEFREAEKDASVQAYRSASAMLRSTLEKTLKGHGYTSGTLESKINDAAEDGIITLPLKKRAHSDIRVLGNNILHDEWRKVDINEFENAHEYTRRVLECFYDDPETVKNILEEKSKQSEAEQPQKQPQEQTV